MKFWKMQGCGNDFIIIDGRFSKRSADSYSTDAQMYCSRKFSIGADGFIVVKNSDLCDIQMVYYNADGSRAAMCGNGIRCFSRYVFDNKIVDKSSFTVETLNGVQNIKIDSVDLNDNARSISVDMGEFYLDSKKVPVNSDDDIFLEKTIIANGKAFKVSSVLVGVPHTIIFTDNDLKVEELEIDGAAIEKHQIFPKKTNVNFVRVINRNEIFVQTWERGCGYTFGCGTGMAASAVIANQLNKVNNSITVHSIGGSLEIKLNNKNNTILMKGSAEKTYSGETE